MATVVQTGHLVIGAIATGVTALRGPVKSGRRSFQATVVGTGAVGATVVIQVSNDGVTPATLTTLTLSGTTSATLIFDTPAPYAYIGANITAISGTGATVDVYTGTNW